MLEPIPLSLEDLDYLLDVVLDDNALLGYPVDWHHSGRIMRLERLDNGGFGLPMTLICETCGADNPELVYAISGLHPGAWCYVADKSGKYLANMRDQSWFCDACAAGRQSPSPSSA